METWLLTLGRWIATSSGSTDNSEQENSSEETLNSIIRKRPYTFYLDKLRGALSRTFCFQTNAACPFVETWTTAKPGKCTEQMCSFQSLTSLEVKQFSERLEDYPPGLRDEANSDQRLVSMSECMAGLCACSGTSFTGMGLLTGAGPSWKLSLLLEKACFGCSPVAVQKGVVQTWNHHSISLKRARVVQPKAQLHLCSWGTHLLRNGARCQQTEIY